MKNKFLKNLTCFGLALILGVTIVACGGGNSNSTSGGTETVTNTAKGEMIDSTQFQVLCPDGYLNVKQTDVFGEQDAEGNYPINPKMLQFCKGAESEFDVFSNPSVVISIVEGTDIESDISMTTFLYDEVEEKDFTIGNETYPGYSATMASLTEDSNYTYDVFYLEKSDTLFKVSVQNMDNAEISIDVTDSDVANIVESITI